MFAPDYDDCHCVLTRTAQAGLALQLDSSAVAMWDASKSALEYLALVTGRRADQFTPGDRTLMERHLHRLRYGMRAHFSAFIFAALVVYHLCRIRLENSPGLCLHTSYLFSFPFQLFFAHYMLILTLKFSLSASLFPLSALSSQRRGHAPPDRAAIRHSAARAAARQSRHDYGPRRTHADRGTSRRMAGAVNGRPI
jgi:hypothetical protein